jgi:choline kinase
MDEPLEPQELKDSGVDDAVVHEESGLPEGRASEAATAEGKEVEPDEEEEEFDYLAYAQERAFFFWGDVLQLGLVKKEDLPAQLLQKVKVVEY